MWPVNDRSPSRSSHGDDANTTSETPPIHDTRRASAGRGWTTQAQP